MRILLVILVCGVILAACAPVAQDSTSQAAQAKYQFVEFYSPM